MFICYECTYEPARLNIQTIHNVGEQILIVALIMKNGLMIIVYIPSLMDFNTHYYIIRLQLHAVYLALPTFITT